MEHDEFEVTVTLVTLARSGKYRRKEPLFEKMFEIFPGLSQEELEQVVKKSFGAICSTL